MTPAATYRLLTLWPDGLIAPRYAREIAREFRVGDTVRRPEAVEEAAVIARTPLRATLYWLDRGTTEEVEQFDPRLTVTGHISDVLPALLALALLDDDDEPAPRAAPRPSAH